MKSFKITEFNNELLDKFIEFINKEGQDDLNIYLDSPGGLIDIQKYICCILNKHPFEVTVFVSTAYSSAFQFLYDLKDKVNLVFTSFSKGMMHFGYIGIRTDERGKKVFDEDKMLSVMITLELEESKRVAKECLTDKQCKSFLKGNDVYLTSVDLKRIFPKHAIC